jgi:hypothetical protein
MRRNAACRSLLPLLGLLAGTLTAVAALRPAPPASVDAPDLSLADDDPTLDRLTRRVRFDGFSHSTLTLQDALDQLGRQHGLRFVINQQALADDDLPDPANHRISTRSLPPRDDVAVQEVLRRLLRQLPATSGATFTIRRGAVEITTIEAQRGEFGGPRASASAAPLVHVAAVRRSLARVLTDLAEQADCSLVIDPRLGDRALTPVSLRLRNTPFDAAIHLAVAPQGLGCAILGNVVYLTSRDNAMSLARRYRASSGLGR